MFCRKSILEVRFVAFQPGDSHIFFHFGCIFDQNKCGNVKIDKWTFFTAHIRNRYSRRLLYYINHNVQMDLFYYTHSKSFPEVLLTQSANGPFSLATFEILFLEALNTQMTNGPFLLATFEILIFKII